MFKDMLQWEIDTHLGYENNNHNPKNKKIVEIDILQNYKNY